MTSGQQPLRLAITTGEPAGIGPEICLQAMAGVTDIQLILIGDEDLLRERAQRLNLPSELPHFDAAAPAQPGAFLRHVPLTAPVTAGVLNDDNSLYVLETLKTAVQGSLDGLWDGIVTAPVHKGIINDAGIPFSGHTEYFRDYCGCDEVVMMLATTDLRVALVTTHLPLKDVAAACSAERIQRVARILHQDLQSKFGIQQPRILVAGLNPHAGEDGHLGREELDVIIPALDALRAEGLNLTGPLPADTLFTPRHLQQADAVLAMYHDQGLPVLKFHGFGRAANITLGLPVIRTSVDHGTALDLAGTGQADPGSLYTAIEVAAQMAAHMTRNQTA